MSNNVLVTGNLVVEGTNNIEPVYSVSQAISAAQMKLAHASPIEIISAPGVGKAIVIVECVGSFTYIAPAYTGASTQSLAYDTSTTYRSGWIVAGASQYPGYSADAIWRYEQGVGTKVMKENSSVSYYSWNASEWADGNGTFIFDIKYMIVDV